MRVPNFHFHCQMFVLFGEVLRKPATYGLFERSAVALVEILTEVNLKKKTNRLFHFQSKNQPLD